MPTKFTIGTDPEFFLYDTDTNAYVSAHDKVPGNKKEPFKMPDGSGLQADGLAVEFNIEPASTGKEFANKVVSAISEIRKIVPKKYAFHATPVAHFNKKYFDTLPDYAKELGCDPDYNGSFKNLRKNTVPKNINTTRTGSGHIHIGWTKDADVTPGSPHFLDCQTLLHAMETFYSNAKYYMDGDPTERERYYGGPYAFRPKPYGLEYRSPSNIWLLNRKAMVSLASDFLKVAREAEEGRFHFVANYSKYCFFSVDKELKYG